MKYSYHDWHNKTGTVPVKWNRQDYESLSWSLHPRPGYTTTKENFDIYGDRIGCYTTKFNQVGKDFSIPKEVDAVFGYVLDHFDLRESVYNFTKYTPGMLLPWHRDDYPTYSKNKKAKLEELVRIVIFLHDPAPGHQLWIEDRLCTGPSGTWFAWEGSTEHMAANLGNEDRTCEECNVSQE